jgi:hypothetical protein
VLTALLSFLLFVFPGVFLGLTRMAAAALTGR